MKTPSRICGIAAFLFLPVLVAAQETSSLVPALGWQSSQQGNFPTSIAADARNQIWVGTEDRGLWRYDPSTKAWTQFTSADGLGDDNIYALAVDKLNRVWAGHLNHGVSVWNGEKWKNYGLLDGPLGDRVFAIATCPTDGDVWIATDCGLARYSIAKDDWDYFTRASGLPSNQFQCIAFDSDGNIIAGTQCDGIATANAADGYKKWRISAGPLRMPASSGGSGLSTNIVNCITTYTLPPGMYHAKADIVDAWTRLGQCESSDKGGSWTFTRGADWQANVSGLYQAPNVGEPTDDASQQLFLEDWITCVQQDPETKNNWIGYRQKGLEVRDINGKPLVHTDAGNHDSMLVRAICVRPKAPPLVAIYDSEEGGLKTLENSTATLEPGTEAPKTDPPFPGPAKVPTVDSLESLSKHMDVYQKTFSPGDGAYLGDDWRTEGDWVGRYGTSYAILCGVNESAGEIYARQPGFEVKIGVGPHNVNDAGTRLHTAHAVTEDPHVLYSPALGHRSESEINDGSYDLGDYPFPWEGPDLWVNVKVPAGTHCVSLYFRNDDGHDGHSNKLRDYDLQLLPASENPDEVQKADPLARARVYDFWGGVYKQFVVAGPGQFVLRAGRNRSFGVKLQGVFIDQQTGVSPGIPTPIRGFESIDYSQPKPGDISAATKDNPLLGAASKLWDKLSQSLDRRYATGVEIPLCLWAYRAAVAAKAPGPLLANWRWNMAIWTQEDREGFKDATGRAYQALQTVSPATGN